MPRPIEGTHYLTQGYGQTEFARTSGLYKAFGNSHPGLDFGTYRINLPVSSTCPGKVVAAGANGGWGNMVEVEGSDGWRRMYAHLSSIAVQVGDQVMVGTTLGRVGSTGASTAIHLHWGHRRKKLLGGWEYRDPSFELDATAPSMMPSKRLIKAKDDPRVYVWNGRKKFHIPDMETYVLLFRDEGIEELEADIITKLPEGSTLTSLK